MSHTTSNSNSGVVPFVGRILVAAIFILSGLGKIGAPAATQGYIAAMGLPAPMLAYIGSMQTGGRKKELLECNDTKNLTQYN